MNKHYDHKISFSYPSALREKIEALKEQEEYQGISEAELYRKILKVGIDSVKNQK